VGLFLKCILKRRRLSSRPFSFSPLSLGERARVRGVLHFLFRLLLKEDVKKYNALISKRATINARNPQ
jgi:hypothetical protein